MVNLVRYKGVPPSEKRAVDGPCPGGYFFTLEGTGGGEGWQEMESITISLQELLGNGCKVWMAEASMNPEWEEVNSEEELPEFSIREEEEQIIEVAPFLPQFYVLPLSPKRDWQ